MMPAGSSTTLSWQDLRRLVQTGQITPEELRRIISARPDAEVIVSAFDWELYARDKQKPPSGDWTFWLILAGRGWGKTRTGAEYVIRRARGGHGPIALIGETAADVRDVMVETGPASIMKISPPDFRPHYEPSKRRLTWPNGVIATTFSGDTPNQLRGPQHATVWADEPAKWQRCQESWDNMELGLRVGTDPRCIATTTPRPLKLLRELVKDPRVVVTTGSSYENLDNLAPAFRETILSKYEGTRLGRQEIHAELLEEAEGALWSRDMIEAGRVKPGDVPAMKRIVVAVDPEGGAGETGIGAAGLGVDGHGYVFADETMHGSPFAWGAQVVSLYRRIKADRIVVEKNFGGDMVASTIYIQDENVPVKMVTASRGKKVRAEPVSALFEYENRPPRVHIVGQLRKLEDEMVMWDPEESDWSPHRIDWMVWAITDLFKLGQKKKRYSTGVLTNTR